MSRIGNGMLPIGVEGDDVSSIGLPTHKLHTGLQCGALPEVEGVLDNACPVFAGDCGGAVRGSVIDTDDVGECPLGIINDLAYHGGLVIKRHHKPAVVVPQASVIHAPIVSLGGIFRHIAMIANMFLLVTFDVVGALVPSFSGSVGDTMGAK